MGGASRWSKGVLIILLSSLLWEQSRQTPIICSQSKLRLRGGCGTHPEAGKLSPVIFA